MNRFYYLYVALMLGMFIGCVSMYFDMKFDKPDKHIDLPEEWEAVKTGDTLKVYRINQDTIFIGFYNSENKADRIYN